MSGIPYPNEPQYGRRGIQTDQLPRLPRVRIHNSAAQSIANATVYVSPTLDAVDYDTHGFVTGTTTPYLTVRRAGLYWVKFSFQLLTTGAIPAVAGITVNGTAALEESSSRPTNVRGAQDFPVSAALALQRGDTVGARLVQDSGAALTLPAGGGVLQLVWLGNL